MRGDGVAARDIDGGGDGSPDVRADRDVGGREHPTREREKVAEQGACRDRQVDSGEDNHPCECQADAEPGARRDHLPRRRAMRAAQTGWVATRATELATVVNERLGTQAAKWSARNRPARRDRRRSTSVRAAPGGSLGGAQRHPAAHNGQRKCVAPEGDGQRRRRGLADQRRRGRHRGDRDGEQREVDRRRAAAGCGGGRRSAGHRRTGSRASARVRRRGTG